MDIGPSTLSIFKHCAHFHSNLKLIVDCVAKINVLFVLLLSKNMNKRTLQILANCREKIENRKLICMH